MLPMCPKFVEARWAPYDVIYIVIDTGNLGICGSGYLEIWNSWHLDTVQKNGAIFVLFDFRFT